MEPLEDNPRTDAGLHDAEHGDGHDDAARHQETPTLPGLYRETKAGYGKVKCGMISYRIVWYSIVKKSIV